MELNFNINISNELYVSMAKILTNVIEKLEIQIIDGEQKRDCPLRVAHIKKKKIKKKN